IRVNPARVHLGVQSAVDDLHHRIWSASGRMIVNDIPIILATNIKAIRVIAIKWNLPPCFQAVLLESIPLTKVTIASRRICGLPDGLTDSLRVMKNSVK